ncbi:ATP-binding cassette domain-containing protein [Halosimplex aquaticum]
MRCWRGSQRLLETHRPREPGVLRGGRRRVPGALRERHDALLEQLSLAEKADEPVNDLSRGQKQKVSLACALARDVEVAFLDEPTLGLDVESSVELRREIRRLADQEDMTIVLSSHDMDVVQDVCDRVVIMNGGEVIADDAVADLIDVFRTSAYRLVVGTDADGSETAVDDETRERLRDAYDVDTFESRGERTAFDVALGDPERFYDLMDDLRDADLTVHEVESIDPDLEDVFLELTNGDGATPADRANGGDRQ